MTAENTVYWDPYRTEFWANPHPVFKRLRQEAPLYRNEQHDFYALSRFSDVERGLTDKEHLSSSRGYILEYIKMDLPKTPGPVHLGGPAGTYRPPRRPVEGIHTSKDE